MHVAGSAQPAACTTGTDPETGDPWVVCEADASGAWISTNDSEFGGTYHAAQICQQLGYQGLGQYGDTLQSVCGVDEDSYCDDLGDEAFSTAATAAGAMPSVRSCVGRYSGSASAPLGSGGTHRAGTVPDRRCDAVGLLTVLGIRSARRRQAEPATSPLLKGSVRLLCLGSIDASVRSVCSHRSEAPDILGAQTPAGGDRDGAATQFLHRHVWNRQLVKPRGFRVLDPRRRTRCALSAPSGRR